MDVKKKKISSLPLWFRGLDSDWGCSSVMVCLPSILEALDLIPSTAREGGKKNLWLRITSSRTVWGIYQDLKKNQNHKGPA
jgi:hypothetical protein